MCFGHEDKRLNYLKSWAVFFMIASLLTIYKKPDPMVAGSGGVNYASVFGLVLCIAPFVATQKQHFQIVCCLYGTSGAFQIVLGVLLATAVFAMGALVGTANTHGQNAKENADRDSAQKSAATMIIVVGMIPVIVVFLGAMCSCCAGHYAHQVATYLEKGSLDDLKNNKAAAEARETVVEPESEQNSDYLRLV